MPPTDALGSSRPKAGAVVAVIGGTGFLGRALLETWPAGGPRPRVLVHRSLPPWLDPAPDGVIVQRIELSDEVGLRAALTGTDVLIDLLRPDGTGWCRDAVRVVVAAARGAGVRRCVHTSSIDVHARSTTSVVREDTPRAPDSTYGSEHCDLEDLVLEGFSSAVVVRLGAVFGPGGQNLRWLVDQATSGRRGLFALRRAVHGSRRMHLVSVRVAARCLQELALDADGTGSTAEGVVLLTQDDQDGNDYASVSAAVADATGLAPLPALPAAPRWVLRSVLRARGASPHTATRRFSGERARSWELSTCDDVLDAVRAYAADQVSRPGEEDAA